ncbi:uncharacterized protein LOC113465022 isoform X2 [Ceratina calcarata]|uniref:Uncharacterized protein LOC113465022 isoform X2 n=1 Tax=Ceratina calcarata TaxID=156304 RepID=A0AAJ7S9R7_9HYME|nr:uncharacterized protein LOC113465022 isoform X2 [Ceratina calcarata]
MQRSFRSVRGIRQDLFGIRATILDSGQNCSYRFSMKSPRVDGLVGAPDVIGYSRGPTFKSMSFTIKHINSNRTVNADQSFYWYNRKDVSRHYHSRSSCRRLRLHSFSYFVVGSVTAQHCGPNEEFKNCSTMCEPTCDQPIQVCGHVIMRSS